MNKETIPLKDTKKAKVNPKTISIVSCALSLFVAATSIQIALIDKPSVFQLIALGAFSLALPPFALASLMGVMADNNVMVYKWPDWYKNYYLASLKYFLAGGYFFLIVDKSLIAGAILLISSILLISTIFADFLRGFVEANQNGEEDWK